MNILKRDARHSIRGVPIPSGAAIHCADAGLAANVPSTLDGSTILTFTKGNAATARLKFGGRVEALVVAGTHSHDRASIKTLRAKATSAGLVGTLFVTGGLGGWGRGRAALVVAPIPARLAGRGRGRGVVGDAAPLSGVPVPTVRGTVVARWGRWGRRGPAMGKAALVSVPPELGAVAA
jgi:hypothetical protein